MHARTDLTWQPSLFDSSDGIEVDATFHGLCRRVLADGAWVDHVPGWCAGADDLFERLLHDTPWQGRDVRMYDRTVTEPRLTHRWRLVEPGPIPPPRSGALPDSLTPSSSDESDPPPTQLRAMAHVLGERYGVAFTQIGANLYRDGADSVAWHGDRVARELPEAVVALVSLGATRPFRLRPHGGGPSVAYRPDRGDLLVMGGWCRSENQRAATVMGPPEESVDGGHG